MNKQNTTNTTLLETGRGFVSVWECDEIGHYNVQFYMARKTEADAHLRLALGLPPTNRRQDHLWVRIGEDHVRFHGELRAVDILTLNSGIADIDDTSLTVIHEMRNASTGALSATFVTRWTCIAPGPKDGATETVAWPESVHTAAKKYCAPIPKNAEKFSTGLHGRVPDLNLAQAQSEGLVLTNRSLVLPFMTDVSGHLTAQYATLISGDSAAHLWNTLDYDWAGLQKRGLGTVVLETLTQYRQPLCTGDATLTLSYTRSLTAKTLSFGHLLFNAGTGALATCIEITAVVLDLEARKVTPLQVKDRARFDALAPSFVEQAGS